LQADWFAGFMEIQIPKHIAIIMDGNGRWAQARGYPRFYGHLRGSNRVKEIVREARKIGIKALTLYAFSTENWKRPEEELSVLWKTLKKYVHRQMNDMKKNGIRLHVIGELNRLPLDVKNELLAAMEFLKEEKEMTLTFALSYGGRAEIVHAAKSFANDLGMGKVQIEDLDESLFQNYLWTKPLGAIADVDLLIRTSGEKRLSNYLLWQVSYAEFDFVDVNWPDYSVEEFHKSLENFKNRKRRFGSV
jgi:undecaprenyl diphosphate synthase